jgi:glycosyltransferase involved in cell wall biosynthesis
MINMNREDLKILAEKGGVINLGIIVDTALRIPPTTGVTYRLYYLSRKLMEYGINVKIFVCNRNIETDRDVERLLNDSDLELHIIPESSFYDVEEMGKIIEDNEINILQFEDSVSVLRYYPIVERLRVPIVLEMHDIEHTLQEYFGRTPEEISLSQTISTASCQLSDAVITMTPLDCSELVDDLNVDNQKIFIIPNPIDFSEFKFYGPYLKSDNIVFIGNMYYEPNKQAVEHIIKEIAPSLIEKDDNITFTFVGMSGEELKSLANSNFIFTGSVDDLNEILSQATIALCPITQGSGMKVKILNYCAAGLPIITTELGASGYEKIPSLIVENDLNNFSDIIGKLLDHQKRLEEIGLQNYQFAKQYYDIDVISKKIANVYRELSKLNKSNVDIPSLSHRIEKLPLPLWLEEGRVKKIKNKNYYVVKNQEIRIV